MVLSFGHFFRSSQPVRDKYLARLFGLFSEEVVRAWCACPSAKYEDHGRPTLAEPGQRGHTLDFLLMSRNSGRCYVAELKCELEFENYRYLTLTSSDQLNHHTGKPAFEKLLRIAGEPAALAVRVKGKPIQVDGAILVWGATTPAGRDEVRSEHGFHEVLSVEEMVGDLQRWQPDPWTVLLERYSGWTNELFAFLGGATDPDATGAMREA